jgi:hypothetical protein
LCLALAIWLSGCFGDAKEGIVTAVNAPVQIKPVGVPASVQLPAVGSATISFQGDFVNAAGQVLTADDDTMQLLVVSQPATATVTGNDSPFAAVNGVASISVQVDAAGTYIFQLTSGSGTTALFSALFSIEVTSTSVGAPFQLVFLQQPSNAQVNAAISPAVTVVEQDQAGNVITSDNSTSISLSIASGPSASLSGNVATVSGGVATFSDLALNTPGTYTLTAEGNAGGKTLTSSDTQSFTITASVGAATQLAFGQQPTNTSINTTITPPITVKIEDAQGVTVTSDSSTQVTLSLAQGQQGASLAGSVTATARQGVATFSNLQVTAPGSFNLVAVDTTNPSITAAGSAAFTVADVAAKLGFSQIVNVAQNGTLPTITVSAQDAQGNTVTNFPATTVNLALGTNPGSGTLNGVVAATTVNGVASFSGLSITQPGIGYTLTATTSQPNLTGISNSFNVTPGVGVPAKLAFLQQPSTVTQGAPIAPVVTVQIEDAFGTVVAGATNQVTVGLDPSSTGTGTLTGGAPAQTPTNGIASFSSLSVSSAGTYALRATATGLPNVTATSANFNVTPLSTGYVYVSDINNNQLLRYTFNPANPTSSDLSGTPTSIPVAAGDILISSDKTLLFSTGLGGPTEVYSINPANGNLTLLSSDSTENIIGLVQSQLDPSLYYGNAFTGFTGTVEKYTYNPTTHHLDATQQLLNTSLANLAVLDVPNPGSSPNEFVYGASGANQTVYELNPANASNTPVALTASDNPTQVAAANVNGTPVLQLLDSVFPSGDLLRTYTINAVDGTINGGSAADLALPNSIGSPRCIVVNNNFVYCGADGSTSVFGATMIPPSADQFLSNQPYAVNGAPQNLIISGTSNQILFSLSSPQNTLDEYVINSDGTLGTPNATPANNKPTATTTITSSANVSDVKAVIFP